MLDNTEEVLGTDEALCPYCNAVQEDIDSDSSVFWEYKCYNCDNKFELVDIQEETTYYYYTKKLPLTEEQQQELEEKLARKPIKGQIDIFGHEVGVDSEFG